MGYSDYTTAIAGAYPQAGYGLARKIVEVASRVGAHPYDLANLIHFESNFSPSVRNKLSGATGLIQFTKTTATGLGTSTDALAQMSAEDQMAWVERYLAKYKGKVGSVHALSMSVFYPKAMSWAPEAEFPASVQIVNPGIKTVSDYVAFMMRGRKLPCSTEITAAPTATVVLSAATSAAKAPIWIWPATMLGVCLGLLGMRVLVLMRRKKRRPVSSKA
jgi:hypothetical protein